MGSNQTSDSEPSIAAHQKTEAEGLVRAHLAARSVERRVLLTTSAIGLIGLVILLAVLLQNTPSVVTGN
jgi:hypothetical protein